MRRMFVAISAAAVAALPGFSAPAPAKAGEALFAYLQDDLPVATRAADRMPPAVGAWLTTVTAEPGLSAAPAKMHLASASPIETGAVPSHNDKPAAGPRLSGATHALSGKASYYWQGQMTATGERFDKRALTAAHKTLPFGTRVRVTRVDTGGSVVVRINDRGPFRSGRVIDLSERAAETIGMTGVGVAPVQLEVLGQ